jgi:hypothetical protein
MTDYAKWEKWAAEVSDCEDSPQSARIEFVHGLPQCNHRGYGKGVCDGCSRTFKFSLQEKIPIVAGESPTQTLPNTGQLLGYEMGRATELVPLTAPNVKGAVQSVLAGDVCPVAKAV